MAYSTMRTSSAGVMPRTTASSRRTGSGNKRARFERNTNSVRYQQQSQKLGPVSSMLAIGLIITIAGLLYLVQITKTSVYGFEVGELKSRQSELQAQNETLKVEAARLQSLERVEGSDFAKEFQPTDELTFLPN